MRIAGEEENQEFAKSTLITNIVYNLPNREFNGAKVRIITKGTLHDFWQQYPDAEHDLKFWYEKIKNSDYRSPNEVIADHPKADTVGNNRIVFNICRNKYRLIAVFRYNLQRVYIRFIGTHKEYDRITDIKNI
jgi:mRNA interferase HigB